MSSSLTCNGNLTKADSKRPLQNLWNQSVKIGCAMRHGVVDLSAPEAPNNPIWIIWAIIKPIIMRRWTSGQKDAPLSYFWSYTLIILQKEIDQIMRFLQDILSIEFYQLKVQEN